MTLHSVYAAICNVVSFENRSSMIKQVGDISKEVVRRVWAGEYDLEDLVLMCR